MDESVFDKKTISLTVDVEEWFHTNWFDVESIKHKYFDGEFPISDILYCTSEIIDLFDNYNVKGTFFILGESAERYPELIPLIEKHDHEIACHGYYHNNTPIKSSEFKNMIKQFKYDIKSDVKGFRSPNFNISDEELQILADEGFSYDSSLVPCRKIPGWYGNPKLPVHPYLKKFEANTLTEFPITVSPFLRIPGGGGWYLRNIGYSWIKSTVNSLLQKTGYALLYFHPWEISQQNVSFKEIPFHVFRNTGKKTYQNIDKLLDYWINKKHYEITTISDWMKDESNQTC